MKKNYLSLNAHYSKGLFRNGLFLGILLMLFSFQSQAQIDLIPPGDGDFENALTTFTDNGWTTVQGGDNRIWRIGTPAGSTSGTNAAYTGTATNYNGINLERVNHFYRDVVIPAGATNVQLSFSYRQPNIDDTYDFFYMSTTDPSNTPQQDIIPGAGYNVLFSNTATPYPAFTLMGPYDLTALAGTTVRLVFSVESDGVTPVANPAVDNILLTYIPSGYNLGVSMVNTPVIPACYSSSEVIEITVANNGNVDLDLSANPLTINASISGPNPLAFAPVILNTGMFMQGTSQAITLGSNYDMSASGTYVLTASTSVVGDAATGDDTLVLSFEKYDNPVAVLSPATAAYCEGGSVNLLVEPLNVPAPVVYSNLNDYTIPDAAANGVTSPVSVNSPVTANSLISCTVNIDHSYVGDLTLILTAPDGSTATLATEVGTLGVNYTGTVFTDTASTPIANGVAPFTGYFLPEQAFANLTGPANGTWSLNVADNALFDTGILLDWSISLPSPAGIAAYSWSPATGLSAVNIPNPVANPTATTTYTVTMTDYVGCIGTGTVEVTVNPISNVSQSLNLCAGDSIVVGSNIYTTDGVFTDLLQSSFGCDSTVTTTITLLQPSSGSQTLTLCSGDTLQVGGNSYFTSGIYTDILPASNGCDSTVTTNLTILPAAAAAQSVFLCAGDSIVVGVNTYNASGVYTDVFIAANGCDSVLTTTLSVSPVIQNSQNITICAGDSIVVGTNVYTISGVYNDLFVAYNGCDSTVTTNLTVNAAISATQNLIICPNDSVLVGSNVYNTTGTYTDLLVSAAGCDSLVTTNLTVNIILNVNQFVNICAGDSLVVGNNVYDSTGVYVDLLSSVAGCDSLVTTNLTVNNPVTFTQSLSICDGEVFTVGTSTYTTSGTYTDLLVSSAGCDSTVTTNLTVHPLPTVAFAAFANPFCLQTASYVLSGGSPSGGTYSGAGDQQQS
jgi:subtilisin-like proprotein convertase family protein